MASELRQITFIHSALQKLFISGGGGGGAGVPVAGSSAGGHAGAGSRLQQCEEE